MFPDLFRISLRKCLSVLGAHPNTSTSPSPFSKKATQWGKKWPVPMNLPFFTVEAYVPGGGGVQNQAEKSSKNAFRPVAPPKSILFQNFTLPKESFKVIF